MIDKIVDPNVAAQAYSNSSNIAGQGAVSGNDKVSFSDFLEGKTREAIDTMKESEKMSGKAVMGDADLTDVVEAVTAAELTLQTVVAVRDRLVSAYQDILRMPI